MNSYDFSEAQSGKDVCDRIISPMKGALRRYCNEGHDIMTASGMHEAFKERQVKGASAAVCELIAVARKLKSTVSAMLVLSTIFPTNRKDFVSERYITLMLVDLFHGQSLSCKSKGLCS